MKRSVIGILAAATLLGGAVLALPTAVLAQGAGDEQYTDPLGDELPAEPAPAPEPTPAPESAPAPSAPVAPDASGSAPAPVDPATGVTPEASAAPGGETLPLTGVDERLPASAGAILLGLGMLLRLRLAPSRS